MNKNRAALRNPATLAGNRRVAPVIRAAEKPNLGDSGRRPVLGVERRLLRWLLRMVGDPPLCLVLWTGEEIGIGEGKPVARIIFRSPRALWRVLLDPDVNFGDEYSAGGIEIEGHTVELIEALYRSSPRHVPRGFIQRRILGSWRRARRNSLRGSRENIHHHYDIGNDFYRLWLDEQMVYTCAYFPDANITLEQAQSAKMDHVCRKLQLKPGRTVVEAGCGWGSLARHMAKHYGVKVKAYNISHQQILYARERARAEDLDGRVEYIEDDYRNIRGEFDAFVSVGMLEHVGVENYRELGAVVQRCLKQDGYGLIHTIGRNKARPMHEWIEKRIFPGAYPPTLREMMEIFEPCELSILDVENLRLHYAKTLEHWLWRFEKAADRVAAMYDEAFVRAWRLYLAGSTAAFYGGELQLFQVVFAPRLNNDVPWTRAHLYPN